MLTATASVGVATPIYRRAMSAFSREPEGRPRSGEIDLLVWQEVARIRGEWIVDPCLSTIERTLGIDEEARQLTARISQRDSHLLDELIAGWIKAYDRIPTADTIASFANAAHADARRQVLCEDLYSLIPPESIAERHRAARSASRPHQGAASPDPHRWRDRTAAASPMAESIVLRTWQTAHSADFILLALALVDVRLQDRLPIPVTPLDPLAEVLTSLIHDQLVAQGLPPA
ncbi:hypothetical protein [Nocardia rhizosphaerihabitans]|uniref:Uncharacterized protein n=1 Tax=Nocardia rhizosphaerihabitans TaxID=1691570 RepID=A0ABQ2K5A6_9NOCA|nr:hypothetical protein [Nocardia rhizosphaerihabitans]GGN66217.1 hypothetical protein GCM10011610_00950 [Nocardia rhizosphaerihabitans]